MSKYSYKPYDAKWRSGMTEIDDIERLDAALRRTAQFQKAQPRRSAIDRFGPWVAAVGVVALFFYILGMGL